MVLKQQSSVFFWRREWEGWMQLAGRSVHWNEGV